MVKHHGKSYSWKHTPIDAVNVHASGVKRLMDGEIIIIFVLYFDVPFKYTLHTLNFEGTLMFNEIIDLTEV
jgi:hypothetical protein